ncbi:MAG: cbb3-type cytochrome c oxidase subunit 3 [Burkholderiaceae bacterium]
MDAGTLRGLIAVVSLIAFLGIVWFAYGRGRRKRFDEAANLPFADEEMDRRSAEAERRGADPDPDSQHPPR